MTAFIAIDWGTTNRRVFRIEGGVAVAGVRDDRGVKAMAGGDYAAEIAAIRAAHGDLPVLIAGMAGSTIGWIEVPYVDAPVGLADLAAGRRLIAARTAILPGVAVRDAARPDVMRGEEVQVLGAIAAGLAPGDAIICQPGTHNKWVTVAGGAITAVTSVMTGELFALLKQHSVLAAQLQADAVPGPAFADGVRAGMAGDPLAALFGVRAGSVLGLRADTDAASHASGVLIGADVGARGLAGRTVHLLADGPLAALYGEAIRIAGGTPLPVDSEAAFIAGMIAIEELSR